MNTPADAKGAPAELVQKLAKALKKTQRELDDLRNAKSEPIAIVGIGCRFPGADGPEGYWRLLSGGTDAIREVPADRWNVDDYYDPDPSAPNKTCSRWGGYLDGVDKFDAGFFGISPREAGWTDPQQRLVLEVAWEALEDAGLPAPSLAGSKTGVFVGVSSVDWALQDFSQQETEVYLGTGCSLSLIANRLSYILDLQGPSQVIDTACSSSLVAVHAACNALRRREADVALTGGVNVLLEPRVTVALSRGRMLSPTGRCHTFDAAADGYVRGEGCGVVVLKRLADAKAAGDRIIAVIRGTAVNQDGRSNGLTAPNGLAQEAVVKAALADAGVEPSSVDYIEAHGTGTELGDPIEIEALWSVFGRGRNRERPLIVGSAKTNIGHLEGAAGIAGLIKAALSLYHGQVAPHLHFQKPNPMLGLEHKHLTIPTQLQAWPKTGKPRVAGVSSFGFGGTNSHAVLEEPPQADVAATQIADRPCHVLALSARSGSALAALADRFRQYLQNHPEAAVADVVFTAATGRAPFPERLAVVARTGDEMRQKLEAFTKGQKAAGVIAGRAADKAPKVAFLFTGQGSQYAGMGRRLFDTAPVFRDALTRCGDWLRPYMDRPLLEVLYPTDGQKSPIDQTAYTQPALVAVEYALAELWKSWGVVPDVVMGHSVGEIAAACVAGVLSPQDALRLAAERGRLMGMLPAGGVMAAVFAPEEKVDGAIGSDIAIAALNGPTNIVISGPKASVDVALQKLSTEGIRSQSLVTSHAFHSPMMEPALDALEKVAAGLQFSPPKCMLISNLTGRPVEKNTLADPAYWRRHARQPVRFAESVRYLAGSGYTTLVEIGPAPTLLSMARRCWPEGEVECLPSWRPSGDEWETILGSLGSMYVRGISIDWAAFDRGYSPKRLSLPTYPFDRERYWVPAGNKPHSMSVSDDCLYEIAWRPQPRGANATPQAGGRWLVLARSAGVRDALKAAGQSSILAEPGREFRQVAVDRFEIDPANASDYRRLLEAVGPSVLAGVVHLWSEDDAAPDAGRSALYLAQALSATQSGAKLWLATRGNQPVDGKLSDFPPVHATLWGLGRALGLEQPKRWGGLIDFDPDASGDEGREVVAELLSGFGEDQVAFRGGRRFVARLTRLKSATGEISLKHAAYGRYLIAGGLGGLGLAVAELLAKRGAKHLVLMGRRGMPNGGPAVETITKLRASGVVVEVLAADVAEYEPLRAAVAKLTAEGPPLRGVIHAAGVAGFEPIESLDRSEWDRVVNAKLLGGWNLHRLTEHVDLDFFVCFSSISAVWGSGNQTHYAAGNAALDALVAWRRARGLPGQSIAWGPWDQIGMMPEDARHALSRIGVEGIAPSLGLALFEKALAGGPVNAVAAKVDWPAFCPIYEAASGRKLFAELTEAPSQPEPTAAEKKPKGGELAEQLRNVAPAERRDFVLSAVRRIAGEVLKTDPANPPSALKVARDLGFDSLLSVEFARKLGALAGKQLPATLLFECPTLDDVTDMLCRDVLDIKGATEAVRDSHVAKAEPIAIVGMACRLPGGVDGPESYWNLMTQGIDAIREVPPSRWDVNAWYDPEANAQGKMNTRWGGFLDHVEEFDAAFFNISEQEATRMDPQQRLLLEVSWEALEDAGLPPTNLRGEPVGVFIGISLSEYGAMLNSDRAEADVFTPTGSATSIAANRVSFAFDFRGPSLSIDTACSSSLVAVHLACRSLWSGESRVALAGGVNVVLSPQINVNLTKGGFLAPDGRCRSFDAAASGYVRSEGTAIVVLKPLSAAIADGDRIYAVVAGSAVNQDGRSNGLTAPNRLAQEEVLRRAYESAQIPPAKVRYIEAHGTGTPLGDPIEARALANVLGKDRPAGQICALGAVKSNIGHTESCAGAAGIVKVALCLHHRQLPATLHYRKANPEISFEETPLRVQQSLGPWPNGDGPLVAGVSSFGFGGTNAHVVLTEARLEQPMSPSTKQPAWILPLSARTGESLEARAVQMRDFLSRVTDDAALADILHTAAVRRDHHDFRLAAVGDSAEKLIEALETFIQGENTPSVVSGRRMPGDKQKIAFVFSGQGPQWWGMGRQLLDTEPDFAAFLQRCDQILNGHGADWSLLQELRAMETESRINQTEIAQPALVALQLGLAQLWRGWGIVPDAVTGHSLGEISAAQVSGAISLEDALRIGLLRGRAMQRCAGLGRMAAVNVAPSEVEPLLEGDIVIAAVNGPQSITLSGDKDVLDAVIWKLEAASIQATRLHVDCAFHSRHMEPARHELEEALRDLQPGEAAIPIYSTVTGRAIKGTELGAAHWGRNIREPVRFADAINQLVEKKFDVFLEVGPHPVLGGAMAQCLKSRGHNGTVLGSLRREQPDYVSLFRSLAALYARGFAVNWKRLYPSGNCVRLPAYPWQHRPYWLESISPTAKPKAEKTPGHPLLGRSTDLAYPPGCKVWESRLIGRDLASHGYQSFDGAMLIPGALFVERAAAAAKLMFGEECSLGEIDFPDTLFLPTDGAAALQLILTPTGAGEATFAAYCRPEPAGETDGAWAVYATGTARRSRSAVT